MGFIELLMGIKKKEMKRYGGFCSGNLKYNDEYGDVKCDRNNIPYFRGNGKRAGWNNRRWNLNFVKPYETKTYTLTNCNYKVGPYNIGQDLDSEEKVKLKLCATVIWALEKSDDETKTSFNKWFQKKYDGRIDEADYLRIYGNIVKMCSMESYEYNCRPSSNCKSTFNKKNYANGAAQFNEQNMTAVWEESKRGGHGIVAYVKNSRAKTIYICPIMFMHDQPKLQGLNSRLGTIFHEYSHLSWTLDTHDKIKILESRNHYNVDDEVWDNNAEFFNAFVEDLYREVGNKTWEDVAAIEPVSSAVNLTILFLLILLISRI